MPQLAKIDQAKVLSQYFVREPSGARTVLPILATQPLPEPLTDVPIHDVVGMTDRAQLEVVRPPNDFTVEQSY